MKKLHHAANWIEIPVADLSRARSFYERIFGLDLFEMELANGLKMALFPVEENTVGAALCEHKDFYFPGREGPLVYLNGNPDLQTVLDRVVEAGGEIILTKRRISETHGFMAVFLDSEGNRIALQSKS